MLEPSHIIVGKGHDSVEILKDLIIQRIYVLF